MVVRYFILKATVGVIQITVNHDIIMTFILILEQWLITLTLALCHSSHMSHMTFENFKYIYKSQSCNFICPKVHLLCGIQGQQNGFESKVLENAFLDNFCKAKTASTPCLLLP